MFKMEFVSSRVLLEPTLILSVAFLVLMIAIPATVQANVLPATQLMTTEDSIIFVVCLKMVILKVMSWWLVSVQTTAPNALL